MPKKPPTFNFNARSGDPKTPIPQHQPARAKTAERGYGGAWQRLRKHFLTRHPRCASCGGAANEVDHVQPKVCGGTDDDANLQALCKPCHSRKTALHNGRWG